MYTNKDTKTSIRCLIFIKNIDKTIKYINNYKMKKKPPGESHNTA